MTKKIAFILCEYSFCRNMGGIGVRAFDLVRVLKCRYRISVISKGKSDIQIDGVKILEHRINDTLREICEADIVFFFDLAKKELLEFAVSQDKFIVLDNALPVEHLEYNPTLDADSRKKVYRKYLSDFRLQVLLADHFFVRAQVERVTLIASLILLGRVVPEDIQVSRTLDHLITLVNIGVNREDLNEIPSKSLVTERKENVCMKKQLLWSGGLWDYMAPESVLKLFLKTNCITKISQDVSLLFLYPPPKAQKLKAAALFEDMKSRYDSVDFTNPTPDHFERDKLFTNAHAIISLAKKGVENETCVRLRIRDVFLYKKPIIVDPYGGTAEYVYQTGIGIVAKSLDEVDVCSAINELFNNDRVYQKCLDAIERERSNVYLDLTLESFLEYGERIKWKPLRSKVEKMDAQKVFFDETVPDFYPPF